MNKRTTCYHCGHVHTGPIPRRRSANFINCERCGAYSYYELDWDQRQEVPGNWRWWRTVTAMRIGAYLAVIAIMVVLAAIFVR